jgi:hypothetical protein
MFNLAEEFPSLQIKHALKMTCVATVIVLSAIAAYAYRGRVSTPARGQTLSVTPYQTSNSPSDSTSQIHAQTDPSLLVLTDVQIENRSNKPLSIFELSGVVKIGAAEYRSLDVSSADFTRVFQYYPDLRQYEHLPLLRHAVLQPGEKLKGMLVFDYPIKLDQWNRRRSFHLNIAFDNERDLIMTEAGETPFDADE